MPHLDTRLGVGVGDGGWQHTEWVQYARTADSAEADDVMTNSGQYQRSDGDQRNDRGASLALTRPTLLERATILMHLEAPVVGYEMDISGG